MERVENLGPGPEKMEGWAEEMCVVLALMPLRSERGGGGGGGQLEALCEALWRARDGPLREERILSSLLRPHCHTLLSHYCSTALRLHRDRLLRETPSTQGEDGLLLPVKSAVQTTTTTTTSGQLTMWLE